MQPDKPRPALIDRPLTGSRYGFSATRIRDLGASEYTLVAIVTDCSGSVAPHADAIERCIAEVVTSCRSSPRSDNLMLRVVGFDQRVAEIHGFLPLASCTGRDYRGVVARMGGTTALFDASHNAIASLAAYGRELVGSGFTVNAIVFVITDGCDNASTTTGADVAAALVDARIGAGIESIASVLVAVGTAETDELRRFASAATIGQWIELPRADAASLARLASFVSRSISVQSRALGTGAAARPVGF